MQWVTQGLAQGPLVKDPAPGSAFGHQMGRVKGRAAPQGPCTGPFVPCGFGCLLFLGMNDPGQPEDPSTCPP